MYTLSRSIRASLLRRNLHIKLMIYVKLPRGMAASVILVHFVAEQNCKESRSIHHLPHSIGAFYYPAPVPFFS
ncbi:hypothetical protein KC19_3G245900 [Ceratodon purpureus]|uniref:Uncharacterized protein n=1 Tax=Ceratodon purpureus TaxID=3225 RepID=A0A8T0IPJ5_CERPU|nr:hypothetical protein KC19_3G245900 [Ceratodon purpureus]